MLAIKKRGMPFDRPCSLDVKYTLNASKSHRLFPARYIAVPVKCTICVTELLESSICCIHTRMDNMLLALSYGNSTICQTKKKKHKARREATPKTLPYIYIPISSYLHKVGT